MSRGPIYSVAERAAQFARGQDAETHVMHKARQYLTGRVDIKLAHLQLHLTLSHNGTAEVIERLIGEGLLGQRNEDGSWPVVKP